MRHVSLPQSPSHPDCHRTRSAHGFKGVPERAPDLPSDGLLYAHDMGNDGVSNNRFPLFSRTIHRGQDKATCTGYRSLGLQQYLAHRPVIFLHRIGEAVTAFVGAEVKHEEVWSSQLELSCPVVVVVLVEKAYTRSLDTYCIEDHSRRLALEYHAERSRGAGRRYQFQLVLSIAGFYLVNARARNGTCGMNRAVWRTV